MRNTVLVPHVRSKIIRPLDPMSSNTHTPFNLTIHTVIVVHCAVMPVQGLLCLKGFSPRTIRDLAGKPS